MGAFGAPIIASFVDESNYSKINYIVDISSFCICALIAIAVIVGYVYMLYFIWSS